MIRVILQKKSAMTVRSPNWSKFNLGQVPAFIKPRVLFMIITRMHVDVEQRADDNEFCPYKTKIQVADDRGIILKQFRNSNDYVNIKLGIVFESLLQCPQTSTPTCRLFRPGVLETSLSRVAFKTPEYYLISKTHVRH